jgi:hypothetical protein
VPEMNIAAESEENQKNIGSVRLFLIQNVGLLTGFGSVGTNTSIYSAISLVTPYYNYLKHTASTTMIS